MIYFPLGGIEMSRIILASASPRRRELLTQIGLEFEIMPSQKEEVIKEQDVTETVMNLAAVKAMDIYKQLSETSLEEDILVIGADTVVVLDGKILGKPKDEEDAFRMLRFLQGNTHQVYTGVCLITSEKMQIFYECTDVVMYSLADEDIRSYIRSGEPMDKAGSYAIQGLAAVFVEKICGDYNNVVGLPVASIWQHLMKNKKMAKIAMEHKE